MGKFCPYCFLLKLSFFENVSHMLANHTSITLKQLCHLVNGQPNRIAVKGHFDLC